jgi:hypothetical protein
MSEDRLAAAGEVRQASPRHLSRRLAVVEARVRAVVEHRRADDPDPDDRFRGLYLTDGHVDRLLTGPLTVPTPDPASAAALAAAEEEATQAERAGEDVRLRRLARDFRLDAVDVELLLIALAPDLDGRFERFYGYLNDDVTRRRATVGLALELCGIAMSSGPDRARLGPAGALVDGGLLLVEDDDRPVLTRALRVPDRVTAHLLGDDTPVGPVADLLADVPAGGALLCDPVLVRGLEVGSALCYVRERTAAAGTASAAAALQEAGLVPLCLDLGRLGTGASPAEVATLAAREARLLGGGIVAGPIEALTEAGPAAVRSLAEAPCPVVLVGAVNWDPGWSRRPPLVIDAPVPTYEQRSAMWAAELNGQAGAALDAPGVLAAFRLTPEQVGRAAEVAQLQAVAASRDVQAGDLQAGARSQNAAGLERLARRVEPAAGWDELVLPEDTLAQLREITGRARHRDLVLDRWGMGASSSRGRGVNALFAGESGTGKTMSAEIIAGELGLDLYVIDLSSVVDKYIGETEKNLDRIFAQADRVNGVLLFDEADALFGKRSEVSDARDRYANVEVAYLLQRMERFDGVGILTTNLRSNVDEAFTRRLDAIIDFPLPDEHDRRRLWETKLRASVPRLGDVDLDFLADSFRLSGGEIRNIAVTAAYLAAAQGTPVGMADLIRATEREYRKLGRMCVEAEFGPWFPVIATIRS